MNTQNDYYIEAVEISQRIDRDYKRFAFCCAQVSGSSTSALADDCKMSVSTIQKYRNAYALRTRLEIDREILTVTKLWNAAPMSLWRKAAELESSLELSLEKTFEYLTIASDNGMTRETFAAHIDNKENKTPQWIRHLRRAISALQPTQDDWKTEMEPETRDRYEAAVEWFIGELEAIASEPERL